jgi:hypothetical protein
MKNTALNLLLTFIVFISACEPEVYTRGAGGDFLTNIKDFKVNGVAPDSSYYEPYTNDYYYHTYIQPGDTVSFTFELLIEPPNGEATTLDSLIFEVQGCFASTEIEEQFTSYENVVATHEKFIKEFQFVIDYDPCEFYRNHDVDFTITYSADLEYRLDVDGDKREESYSKRSDKTYMTSLLVPNYQIDTFRLYNNYTGKSFEDSTGVGYDFVNQQYVSDLEYLYCFYEEDVSCPSVFKKHALINLTYDNIYNPDGKIFIPAFSLGHPIRRKNVETNGASYQVVKTHQPMYNLVENHPSLYIDESNYENMGVDLVVKEPQIGDWYSMYTGNSYLQIIDIKEAGQDSYIEFVSYIPEDEI